MKKYFPKLASSVILLGTLISGAVQSAIVDIHIKRDTFSSDPLATIVDSGDAEVAAYDELTLQIIPTVSGLRNIRIKPNNPNRNVNEKCNLKWQTFSSAGGLYPVQPATQASTCSYDITVITQGATFVEQITLIFVDPDTGEDPITDPTPPDHGYGEDFREDFTQGTSDFRTYNIGNVVSRGAHGNRIYCTVSHFSYDDPIINPNQPNQAHLHMFWGNTSTNAHSNLTQLPTTGKSTCTGGTNYRASWWMPALFNKYDEVLIPEEVVVYYKVFDKPGFNYSLIKEVPQGLEMLAIEGTKNFKRNTHTKFSNKRKDNKDVFQIEIVFPSCVAVDNSGKPILSYRNMPNPNDRVVNGHLAYPGPITDSNGTIVVRTNQANCPVSHPYRFPQASTNVYYDAAIAGYKPHDLEDGPYVSSDRMASNPNHWAPNLSTLHADYVFGMDRIMSQNMLRCTRESRSCSFKTNNGNLSERFFDSEGTQKYLFGKLAPGIDRTYYGKTLTPLRSGASHSGHGSHH